MADSNRSSMRTSHAKGIPGGNTELHVPNEDRIVAGPNGLERISGGYATTAGAVYDPNVDAGRHTSGTAPHARNEKPNRQNDAGEMADAA